MAQTRKQRRAAKQAASQGKLRGVSEHWPTPKPGEGRFCLEALLGAGGMCEVHAAVDLRRVEWGDASPRVAVKRLLPEFAGHPQAQVSLVQEFCTLRHLTHPGVVRVFDIHKEPFGICFSMELLEGQSAYDRLAAHPGGLGAGAVGVSRDLFDALAFLHRHGVSHGDIKPSNLFLAPEGRVVLIDFNVAQVTAKPGEACSPVAQGLRKSLRLPTHSLLHASPERLSTGCPSPADDIFSGSISAYELLTGQHPFKGRTAQEAEKQGCVPEKPSPLTARQWSLLRRGLSFEASQRPVAEELRDGFAPRGLARWLAR